MATWKNLVEMGLKGSLAEWLSGVDSDAAATTLMPFVTTWSGSDVTVFASAARTATVNSADITTKGARGARLHLEVTAVSGTSATLDVKLQAKVGGVYIDIAGAAFSQKLQAGGAVTDELVVFPGVAETANESVSDVLPLVWRAVATITGTTPSWTFALMAAPIG